jgi:hypothetical protein
MRRHNPADQLSIPSVRLPKKSCEVMAEWLKINLNLLYTHNSANTSQCAENIKKSVAQTTHRMVALDITNVYSNIRNTETLDIIKTILQNSYITSILQNNKQPQKDVYNLANTTVKQKYIDVNNVVRQHTDGTPMASPNFGILAEIFLQQREYKYYPDMVENR